MSFDIQRSDHEDFQVLLVRGYMGNADCAKLLSKLDDVFGQGCRQVILDFTALTFVTTTSLARLANQVDRLQEEGGDIRCCGLSALVTRLLAFGRLEGLLTVAPDLAAAVELVSPPERLPRPNQTTASRPAASKGKAMTMQTA